MTGSSLLLLEDFFLAMLMSGKCDEVRYFAWNNATTGENDYVQYWVLGVIDRVLDSDCGWKLEGSLLPLLLLLLLLLLLFFGYRVDEMNCILLLSLESMY